MKKGLLILALGLFLSVPGFTQIVENQDSLFYYRDSLDVQKNPTFCLDFGVGYAPKTIEGTGMYDAFRFSVALNNLLFHRFGVWTGFEKNFNSDYFTHILGLTGSITHWAYVYAGMDFFTDHGYFHNNGFEKTRKDVGIGFYPYKWLTLKVGWSQTVEFTGEIGIRIPLEKQRKSYYKVNEINPNRY